MKAYLGERSAIIHAINAGNNVIKTKFLKRRIRHRKIVVEKILFHKNVFLSIIICTLKITIESNKNINPSR